MSYELGQQVALEKVGVFQAYMENLPVPRMLPVRGRSGASATFQATADDTIKNIRKKYMLRAPKASNDLIGALTTVAQTSGAAPVKSLHVGNRRGETDFAYWNPGESRIGFNAGHPLGALLHELGHSLPGPTNDTLNEEVRATQHAINHLGAGHEDVGHLLRAFGTYVQERTPGSPVLTQAPPSASSHHLWSKYRPGQPPQFTEAARTWQRRDDRRTAPQYAALDKEEMLASTELANRKERIAQKLQSHPSETIRAKLDQLFRSRAEQEGRRMRERVAKLYRADYARRAEFLDKVRTIQARLERTYGTPQITLADYAKVQGAEREQLDNWIASMRDKIDQYFWAGAGDTALEPILKRLEELRSAQ